MAVTPIRTGERVKRREDPRLIRGLARYTDDIKLHGMLHAAFVRSDHAAGRIEGVDTAKALQVPGVRAVYTGDALRDRVGPLPLDAALPGMNHAPRPALADGHVRYVGQPIAVVVADDRYAARDGALAVEVRVDPRPAVTDPEKALAPDAPRIYEELESNLAVEIPGDGAEEAERLFREADGVAELRLVNHRVAPVPMEPRAVLAHWDEGPGKLSVWTSTQVPHLVKQHLAACLGIPEIRVRVVAPEVGGGFGCKLPVYPEELVLPFVSRALRRPVKWAETRTENLAGTTHGRGHVQTVEAAYRSDGTVLALRGRIVADLGAYPSRLGPAIPTFTALMAQGCYRIKAVCLDYVGVYTNTVPTDAYRGAGRPEAAYLVERVMDAVAAETGVDRAEVRRRNFVPRDAFPYEAPSGAVYDSGDYEAALDEALSRFDYSGALRERDAARAEGRLVGIGISTFTEVSGFGPSKGGDPEGSSGTWESATVRVEPSGNVTILTGVSPHGQGQETAFAQMAADAFGIGLDDVTVVHGDTDVVQSGVGTFGSRGLVVGGTAVHMAVRKVLEKARRVAAHHLDTTPDRVELEGGSFRAGERSLSFRDVARRAHTWSVPVPGEEPGLDAEAWFDPPGTTFPFGAHLCRVEIDPETGELEIQRYLAVDDCGRVVNPLLAEGQRLGGIVQGLGQALCEEARYDESGQLVTATLMDYAVPKAAMFPRIELGETLTPTEVNPLGAKGLGELGTIGATPCLVGAALDALRPLGVAHIDMPLRPERLWRTIRGAKGEGA